MVRNAARGKFKESKRCLLSVIENNSNNNSNNSNNNNNNTNNEYSSTTTSTTSTTSITIPSNNTSTTTTTATGTGTKSSSATKLLKTPTKSTTIPTIEILSDTEATPTTPLQATPTKTTTTTNTTRATTNIKTPEKFYGKTNQRNGNKGGGRRNKQSNNNNKSNDSINSDQSDGQNQNQSPNQNKHHNKSNKNNSNNSNNNNNNNKKIAKNLVTSPPSGPIIIIAVAHIHKEAGRSNRDEQTHGRHFITPRAHHQQQQQQQQQNTELFENRDNNACGNTSANTGCGGISKKKRAATLTPSAAASPTTSTTSSGATAAASSPKFPKLFVDGSNRRVLQSPTSRSATQHYHQSSVDEDDDYVTTTSKTTTATSSKDLKQHQQYRRNTPTSELDFNVIRGSSNSSIVEDHLEHKIKSPTTSDTTSTTVILAVSPRQDAADNNLTPRSKKGLTTTTTTTTPTSNSFYPSRFGSLRIKKSQQGGFVVATSPQQQQPQLEELTTEPTVAVHKEETYIEKAERLLVKPRRPIGQHNKPLAPHLDPAIFNRIDSYEEDSETRKPEKKRKRGDNLSCFVGIITTRKRAALQNLATDFDSGGICDNFDTGLPPIIGRRTRNRTASVSRGIAAGHQQQQNHQQQQRRGGKMSLYDRRYQTGSAATVTDELVGSVRGNNTHTNGYLTSSGRNLNVNTLHTELGSGGDVGQDGTTNINQCYTTNQFGMATTQQGGNAVQLNHAPSMATLCNIGNTCYLNSVVYTLRFAPQFLHNLHHLLSDLHASQQYVERQRLKSSSLGRNATIQTHLESAAARSWSSKDLVSLDQYGGSGININSSGGMTNSVGSCSSGSGNDKKNSHQLLAEKLHDLYQSLHRNEMAESTEPHHADTLLHAIQDVSTIFEGNQQQDAHEFLMCLLNSLRETTQTLLKTISDCPDMISNGYLTQPDELDAMNEATSYQSGNNSGSNSGGGGSSSMSSLSLSASSLAKSSFFTRKNKQKNDNSKSKNVRLQSPLKDGSGGSNQTTLINQQQPTSNSFFYLNTVDLSGSRSAAGYDNNSPTNAVISCTSSSTSLSSSDNKDIELKRRISPFKDREWLTEKIRELGLDFFRDDFEGITVATTKCLSCETITEQKERMIDISVPVPISGFDSADYIDKPSSFIQNSCITREYFRGENKYRCEQCTGYTEAIRSISFEVLPRLLVIQLSRFSGGMEKINSYIPTSFTLQCFCSKCTELSDSNKLHIYKLYSVITHVGATMSVGHYIAYTCSLEIANEYTNCPKDRRSTNGNKQHGNNNYTNGGAGGVSNGSSGSSTQSFGASAAALAASSSTSIMKKMKFGRSKASSSGDMSKNMKNVNGIVSSKAITNGLSKLSVNTTCQSLSCCATRLSSAQQQHQQYVNSIDCNDESLQNGSNLQYTTFPTAGYGSTGRGVSGKSIYSSSGTTAIPSANGEPIWYMCDDDKIKAMTQREFEEVLSPTRKITVTPYLLFYARFNMNETKATNGNSNSTSTTATTASATTATTTSTTATATTTAAVTTTTTASGGSDKIKSLQLSTASQSSSSSWSNDNLKHSAISGGGGGSKHYKI